MTTVNVYLTFDGNCEEAFNFYKSVFGGEFPSIRRFAEMPKEGGKGPISEANKKKIMHISLPISKETILMGSDIGEEWAADFKEGNNFYVSIHTDTKEEADRLFTRLSENGAVRMPIGTTSWDSYFGMLRDQFGINWMLNVVLPEA